MTPNRELLELAAKAAGVEQGADRAECGISTTDKTGRHGYLPKWNPLEDDGDALRLAVKLGITAYQSDHKVEAMHNDRRNFSFVELFRNDPYAATRLAIVRAAAEIGRNMP